MRLVINIRSYNGGVQSPTLGAMASFFREDLPPFGTWLNEITITAHFHSTSPPLRSLASMHELFHKKLETLPTYELDGRCLQINYHSSLGPVEDVASRITKNKLFFGFNVIQLRPDYNTHLFKSFYCELKEVLSAMPPEVTQAIDFNHSDLVSWFATKELDLPSTDATLEQSTKAAIEESQRKLDAMDPWEKLSINWSEYHRNARTLLDDPIFWSSTDDYSPHGNDTGWDLLRSFSQWLDDNPDISSEVYFDHLLRNWGVTPVSRIFPPIDSIYHEATIALAFAHIKLEARCPEWIKAEALTSIAKREARTPRQPPAIAAQRERYYNMIKHKLLSLDCN